MERDSLADARRADRIGRRAQELAHVREQRHELDRIESQLVLGLRRDGLSWAKIGQLLEVSRQAAEQRFSVKKS
jgi:hypothetical protein